MRVVWLLLVCLLALVGGSREAVGGGDGVEWSQNVLSDTALNQHAVALAELASQHGMLDRVVDHAARPAYSEAIAVELRYFSTAAYCPNEAVRAWKCTMCKAASLANFQIVSTFYTGLVNTFGYAGFAQAPDGSKVGVIVFRGTVPTDAKTVMTDLNILMVPWLFKKGKVHMGFLAAYHTVVLEVKAAVKVMVQRCPTCHFYLTGHSLGGALTTLAAMDVAPIIGAQKMSVYTFGSPRVGDSDFVSSYNALLPDSWRVTHYMDIVPQVPLTICGFRHVATEVWYSQKDGLSHRICRAYSEDPSCINSVGILPPFTPSQQDFVIGVNSHLNYLGASMNCPTLPVARFQQMPAVTDAQAVAELGEMADRSYMAVDAQLYHTLRANPLTDEQMRIAYENYVAMVKKLSETPPQLVEEHKKKQAAKKAAKEGKQTDTAKQVLTPINSTTNTTSTSPTQKATKSASTKATSKSASKKASKSLKSKATVAKKPKVKGTSVSKSTSAKAKLAKLKKKTSL